MQRCKRLMSGIVFWSLTVQSSTFAIYGGYPFLEKSPDTKVERQIESLTQKVRNLEQKNREMREAQEAQDNEKLAQQEKDISAKKAKFAGAAVVVVGAIAVLCWVLPGSFKG